MAGDLVSTFLATAKAKGEATALIDAGGPVSFATLLARAEAFASQCRARGLEPGDRVLLAMPVGAQLFAALAGAWGAGLTVVFPEPAMGLAGLRHAIAVASPKALIASGGYRLLPLITPALWGLPVLVPKDGAQGSLTPPAPEAIALISFTSGSTGAPKAIPRSHGFLMAQRGAVAPVLRGEAVDLVGFPVFTLINLAAGRVSALPDWKLSRPEKVTPEALATQIKRTSATRALLPPSLCDTLARATGLGTLHTVFTGGGPVKPDLVGRLQAKGLRVVSVYGSTEAEPIAELDWAEVSEDDLTAMRTGAGLLAGRPVRDVSLRILDDEIQVAGGHVNAGYLDPAHDAETKVVEAGVIWHRTGDAGRLDQDGQLWLLGRHSAIREVSGQRLYPFAVELAAESWPGVARAALSVKAQQTVLAIEGDRAHLPDWEHAARVMGVAVVPVARIPLDRRHQSKIDYLALAKILQT